MAYNEEQEAMINQFKYALMDAIKIGGTAQVAQGNIYCVFHFPGQQGGNEDLILEYRNRPTIRQFIHQYQQQHTGVFYYSTNRDSLIVDPNDPNRLVPRMGSYEPPYPTLDKKYRDRRNNWRKKFEEETLPNAVVQGGESLGAIYYRWFFIGNATYAKKHPNGIPTTNTEPVRRLFGEEKVRHPHEFFYSCNQNDLQVDLANPLRPPTMGSLFPGVHQPQPSASHGSTSHAVASGPSTSAASKPWVSPTSVHHSPHTVVKPLPLAYLGLWMPELVVPPTATTTTTAGTTTAASDSLPADLQSIDWNALFAEHQALLNENNPAVGMNPIQEGEGAVDLEKIITEPPANQEELDEIVAGLDVMPGGVNAEVAQVQPNIPMMAMQEANNELPNIAAQEGDAEMLGNALMMGMMGADYNPYDFPPHDEDNG